MARWSLFLMVTMSFATGPSSSGTDCAKGAAPLPRTPSTEWIFETVDEQPVAIVTLDPRGVADLQILEELDHAWIDADAELGAWHHRDRQGWRGATTDEACQPRYGSEAVLNADYIDDGIAWIDSKSERFWARQFFIFPEAVDADDIHYDVVIEIGNESGLDLEGYLRIFSCPTPVNRDETSGDSTPWHLAPDGKMAPFPKRPDPRERWVVHPEAAFHSEDRIPHFPGVGGEVVGTWKLPIMVSQPSPGGWRSVILIDSDSAAAIGGLPGSAMNYVVFPGPASPVFEEGDSMVARVRHHLIRSETLPTPKQMEDLYDRFESEWEELDSLLMTFVD